MAAPARKAFICEREAFNVRVLDFMIETVQPGANSIKRLTA